MNALKHFAKPLLVASLVISPLTEAHTLTDSSQLAVANTVPTHDERPYHPAYSASRALDESLEISLPNISHLGADQQIAHSRMMKVVGGYWKRGATWIKKGQ